MIAIPILSVVIAFGLAGLSRQLAKKE